jgi:hypothetical protein
MTSYSHAFQHDAPFKALGVTVHVAPTLALMAGIYRLSREGGPKSPRFTAYTAAAAKLAPISGYNPMTSKDVLGAIDALLAIEAETRLATAANATAAHLGFDDDVTMHLIVAAPGMWTDRLLTDVHHRLLGTDPRGVLLWYNEPVSTDTLEQACVEQTARLIHSLQHGAPDSLRAAVRQEGHALATAGAVGQWHAGAAEVLEVLGEDASLATMTAFLYGDDAADALGYAPLGLGTGVGSAHAVALVESP